MEEQDSKNGYNNSELVRPVSDVGELDEAARDAENKAGESIGNESISSGLEEDITVLVWKAGDPENPYNFSGARKQWIVFVSVITILNATLGSSLPSNIISNLAEAWNIESTYQKKLPISVYIIGYVMGPIFWAPASEQFGRRNIILGSFFIFLVFTMACALARSFPSFLIFRLIAGIFTSAPMVIAAGIFADIFGDPRSRGRAMSFFMVATVFGPLLAPIISGFCAETIGWRWTFWIATIFAGATMILLLTLPETYGPILLQRRAVKIRKADPAARVFAAHELERPDLVKLATVVLTRPIRMLGSELIVSLSSAYLSLVYGVFYMSFSAYPIIYEGVYKMSPGVCGLTYLAIGAGAFLALIPFYWWDDYLFKIQSKYVWARQEEYRRLPLACVGGPLFAGSLFWMGWTAREDIHWAVPMMSGLFYGVGWQLVFIALLNYLTDSYEVFAASANAAASCTRSLVAVVLPLCTTPLFQNLGINGACSLLGGLGVLFCAVPFLFIWHGEHIRANSKFCIYLRQQQEELARKAAEQISSSEKSVRGLEPGTDALPKEEV